MFFFPCLNSVPNLRISSGCCPQKGYGGLYYLQSFSSLDLVLFYFVFDVLTFGAARIEIRKLFFYPLLKGFFTYQATITTVVEFKQPGEWCPWNIVEMICCRVVSVVASSLARNGEELAHCCLPMQALDCRHWWFEVFTVGIQLSWLGRGELT